MNGQLRDHPLAELLREISAERLSGALRLTRERVRAALYFNDGELIYAGSNLRVNRLDESLRRWNIIPHEQLDFLLTNSMTEADIVAALTGAGLISTDDITKLQRRRSEDALRPLLLWLEGEWRYDPRARLPGEMGAPIQTRQLLLESARHLSHEFVAKRLFNDVALLTPVRSQTVEMQLSPTEAFVLSRAESGALSVGDLVALSGLPEMEARKVIYALSLCGLLEREDWPRVFTPEMMAKAQASATAASSSAGRTSAPKRDKASGAYSLKPPPATKLGEDAPAEDAPAQDAQSEIRALFARGEATNHYEVLSVRQSASASEIKRAYYALAKRFHPDRFHSDVEDAAQRTRIENAFAKIARAYEILKDPTQRGAYDVKMKQEGASPAPKPRAEEKRPSQSSPSAPPQQRAEESFQQGMAAFEQGNHALAASHLGEAARLAPKEARYRAQYGRALAREARTRRLAEDELQAAIALDARDISYRVMLAELYCDIGLRRRAEGELQRALAIEPQHAAAQSLLDRLRKMPG